MKTRSENEAEIFESLASIPLDDSVAVRRVLVTAAREGRVMTYSQTLGALGHRFTRPKMRTLCRVIGEIDTAGRAAGEPELAVLVVRESDRLPGQGWWAGQASRLGYHGELSGPEAAGLVREMQGAAFDYWRGRAASEKAARRSRR